MLHHACEEVYSPNWYYPGSADRDRAVARLTEFLPYFDSLAQWLSDRLSTTSRSLSQERALIEQLLVNIRGY